MKRINESGRSMVEMLGVLAIVGVLSIAGVSGYTVAMKKQRANELLNEAVKRAVVLSMKIAAGQSVENGLGEFGSNTVGSSEFSNPTYTAGAETFKMTLSDVDESVLNQMKAMLGDNGVMAIVENCDASTKVCSATLHFNKDLKRGNIDTSDSGDGGQGETTPTCASGIVKVYNCQTKTTTDCCPDTETCEQPTCICGHDDGNDHFVADDSLCPRDQYCDYTGCKCPDINSQTGFLGNDGQTCCLGIMSWTGDAYGYGDVNPAVCGRNGSCPTIPVDIDVWATGELKGNSCCLDGKAWDKDLGSYSITGVADCES